ncbi:MAG: cell division protein FtsL [Desulfuromonadaceae bacterium]|nr:cell division protein FtsL [Desulfuromonadaceae bacterium]MDD5105558.1 cell division protein FtsL [Desulfuromonadaceae bacterium]
MAQARTDYTKVAAPPVLGGLDAAPHRIDLFKYLMICMIVFTIVSVFHVWSRFKLVDLNLQVSEISRQLHEAEQEQKRLKLEAASLMAPARIEMIAKNDLGLALPTKQQIIQVR